MSHVALHVSLKAKPEKADDLAAFLASAQPLAEAEPATLTWYAARLAPDQFVIFDTFADDQGRQAHLQGPIAAALMAHAGELLAQPPEIQFADVLARK
ncbi:MAG TPA: antibiotic biosynthesis monooxygenase [Caulobacteraceae bacterium]|jgi:quinol monooxygenase YgiN